MADRDMVIKSIENCLHEKDCDNCSYEGCIHAHGNCIGDLMAHALELLKSQQEWISVKDRMPEINKDVLILYESKVSHETGYAITCLTDTFYFGSTPIPYSTPQWLEPWQYFRENNTVTHWMPLPKPPEVKHDAKT